ncbi:hypothetical protein SKAU_G00428200 [Synaphobranchus kaupii]|uniref:Receptor ligand binding region domain-containing protein n=1 Tax=Synaphobranchus kaupii TaxID=118154 RepID=A0A9Q1E4Q5_SYNKA|nr:hypothetical protein SKAU_G00428200 [Synaphobranchus kaupii]
MAQLTKRFGWTWVDAIAADNDYGHLAIQAFSEEVRGGGVCLAFFATLSRKRLESDVLKAADVVQSSSARVILVFAWYTDVETLLLELIRRNVTGRQFLASEAWSTSDRLLRNPALFRIARGILGVAIRSAPIPGLEEHLRSLHPSHEPGSTLMRELWELLFECKPVGGNSSALQLLPPCVETETLQSVQSAFTAASQLRITYNIYLAVYAVALALHRQLSCTGNNGTDRSPHCATTEDLQPKQLGDEIYIERGDIRAVYDIVSWQDSPGGSLKYVTIGKMEGSELHMNDSAIVWVDGTNTLHGKDLEAGAQREAAQPSSAMSPLSFLQWLLVLPLQTWAMDGSLSTQCQQWLYSNSLEDPSLSQDGDVILGGLFPIYIKPVAPDATLTKPPKILKCQGLQARGLRWAQGMVFAVEEINQNPYLLPGVKLGYRIMDSCGQYPWSLRGALALVSGRNQTCSKVLALIGDAPSTQCIILSRTLGPLGIPLLAKRFGWTWVGAIVSNNDYGLLAIQAFSEEVKGAGVCLSFITTLSRKRLESDVLKAADVVQSSSARVILVFAWYTDVETLLLELIRRNVTGRQFLASEAWSTSDRLLRNPALFSIARGILGVAIRSAPIPGLQEHLRSLHPSHEPGSTLMRELWGLLFECNPVGGNSSALQLLPPCVGTETLQSVQNIFTDISQLRTTYNIYLAVYAVAHALHSQLSCTGKNATDRSPHCATTDDLQPRQLIRHLNQVQFTTQLGDEIHIERGDIRAVYDIVSWHDTPGGSLKYVTIGKMEGSDLQMNDSAIVWVGGTNTHTAHVSVWPVFVIELM